MTFQLPQSVSTAAGWALSDFRELALTSAPAAGGVAVATGPQVDPAELWLLDHMVVACDSTTRTTLRLYGGSPSPSALLDGSAAGNFDVADWPAGLQLLQSRQLVAVWSGASDGARGTLTVQLRVMRQAAG